MPKVAEQYDVWIDAVLRQNSRPAWLSGDAPENDVVVTSRARLMRNLSAFPFPHRCDRRQLEQVQASVRAAATGEGMVERRNISEAERAVLTGSRLASPEFAWRSPGRSLFVNAGRSVSLMVNEEDHLRLQAVTAGFSIEAAEAQATDLESRLSNRLTFARHHSFGYVGASIENAGRGARLGAMLHLPGLAEQGRVAEEVAMLPQTEARGLLGEMSTGIGAYVQISSTRRICRELSEAILHLILIERTARARIGKDNLKRRIKEAMKLIGSEVGLSLSQAVNTCSWLRVAAELGELDRKLRDLDALLALLTFGHHDAPTTNLRRRRLADRLLSSTLPWSGS